MSLVVVNSIFQTENPRVGGSNPPPGTTRIRAAYVRYLQARISSSFRTTVFKKGMRSGA